MTASMTRFSFQLDSVVTGANGAVYLILAGPLADLLDIPADALRALGAFLLAFAAFVWVAQTPAARAAVVTGNAAWVVASVAVLLTDAFTASTVGAVWIALQAVVVGGFALLQSRG